MSTNILRSAALGLSFSLAASPAMADGLLSLGGDADIKIGVNADASLGKQFKALDADGDGVITRQEAEASGKVSGNFDAFDKDGDDELTQGEFSSGLRARADGAVEGAKERGDDARAAMEAGAEASAEAGAEAASQAKAGANKAAEAGREAGAKAADKARAGVEASGEAAGNAAAAGKAAAAASANAGVELSSKLSNLFGELDADGNGVISESEAQADSDIAANFESADENNDGLLNKAEFKVAAEAEAETGFFGRLFGG